MTGQALRECRGGKELFILSGAAGETCPPSLSFFVPVPRDCLRSSSARRNQTAPLCRRLSCRKRFHFSHEARRIH